MSNSNVISIWFGEDLLPVPGPGEEHFVKIQEVRPGSEPSCDWNHPMNVFRVYRGPSGDWFEFCSSTVSKDNYPVRIDFDNKTWTPVRVETSSRGPIESSRRSTDATKSSAESSIEVMIFGTDTNVVAFCHVVDGQLVCKLLK